MRRPALVLSFVLITALVSEGLAEAAAEEAPFGFSWGPVNQIPRPSMAQRESNITALIYLRDRVPPELRDTEEVVLEVCAVEGLQHILWVSRPLSETEAGQKYEAALSEGKRRFGEPENDPSRNGVVWRTGRTTLSWAPAGTGLRRIIMTTTGPEFDACSKRHLDTTGHPATEHIADLWTRR